MNDVKQAPPRPDDTAPMTQPLQTLTRTPPAPREPTRWRRVLRRVGVFWPVFGISLVVAVVFVATVAYSSMNGVGSPDTAQGDQAMAPARRPSSFVIVQVASQTSQGAARDQAAKLKAAGFAHATVVRSDDYRPLKAGYWVVSAGTYPLTKDGHVAAERDQKRLPENLKGTSRIRDIHPQR